MMTTTNDANAKVWQAARDEASERQAAYDEWRAPVEDRLDHAAGAHGWVRWRVSQCRDAKLIEYREYDGDGRIEVRIVALAASEMARRVFARDPNAIWYGDLDGKVGAIVRQFARDARP